MNKILLTDDTLYDKLKAHKEGLKHFAFSVFLFDDNGKLLLQKRAKNKYHSGGLWSNTCCSHFKDLNEFDNRIKTAKKRLLDELGLQFDGVLNEVCILEYKANVDDDLIENEIDYIFTGILNEDKTQFSLNVDEVEEIKFITLDDLKKEIALNKDKYTEWLKIICDDKQLLKQIRQSLTG